MLKEKLLSLYNRIKGAKSEIVPGITKETFTNEQWQRIINVVEWNKEQQKKNNQV